MTAVEPFCFPQTHQLEALCFVSPQDFDFGPSDRCVGDSKVWDALDGRVGSSVSVVRFWNTGVFQNLAKQSRLGEPLLDSSVWTLVPDSTKPSMIRFLHLDSGEAGVDRGKPLPPCDTGGGIFRIITKC
ncbi:uncharacterized protein YALI1_C18082g [Yarrowia lipolytica]|uniref:Uncharacterized protein n=1 Tax=Yarrowia lipolytica TaxID=4952 RepID=A0A1D8NAX0_YARLL|nr:hypothetical protein YALI1_C18082g [Yarrowia lipolytica]